MKLFGKELNLQAKGRQPVILAALGGLILFVLYLNLLFKPTIAGLKEVNPELRKLIEDTKRIERWINERDNMEKQLKELQSKIGYYETALSAEEEIPSLLEELSEMARKSDVEIIGIKPKKIDTPETKKKMSYQEIPISIEAKCGYHQLGRFISKLETANRLLAIRNISIKGNPQTPYSHDVNLIVSAFLLLEG